MSIGDQYYLLALGMQQLGAVPDIFKPYGRLIIGKSYSYGTIQLAAPGNTQ
jgi:hypothetical protein